VTNGLLIFPSQYSSFFSWFGLVGWRNVQTNNLVIFKGRVDLFFYQVFSCMAGPSSPFSPQKPPRDTASSQVQIQFKLFIKRGLYFYYFTFITLANACYSTSKTEKLNKLFEAYFTCKPQKLFYSYMTLVPGLKRSDACLAGLYLYVLSIHKSVSTLGLPFSEKKLFRVTRNRMKFWFIPWKLCLFCGTENVRNSVMSPSTEEAWNSVSFQLEEKKHCSESGNGLFGKYGNLGKEHFFPWNNINCL